MRIPSSELRRGGLVGKEKLTNVLHEEGTAHVKVAI